MVGCIIRHSLLIFGIYGWNVCFWVVVVKNGRGVLDHGTLESAVSQEIELIKLADFLAC